MSRLINSLLLRNTAKLLSIITLRQRRFFYGFIVLATITSFLQAVTVGILPFLARAFQNPNEFADQGILRTVREFLAFPEANDLTLLFAIFIALFLVSKVAVLSTMYYRSRITRDFEHDIGIRLFGAYTRAPYVSLLGWNSSQIIRNLHQEVGRTVSSYTILSGILMHTINALGIIVLLLVMEPLTSLVIFAFVSVGGGVLFKFTRKHSEKFGRRVQTQVGKMIKSINHGIGGLKDTRILQVERTFFSHFSVTRWEAATARHRQRVIQALIQPALEVLGVFILVVIIVGVVVSGETLQEALPSLALFAGALARILPAATGITNGVSNFYFKSGSAALVADELFNLRGDEATSPVEFSGRTSNTLPFSEKISINRISFAYPNTEIPALDRVDLDIQRGQMIGFVGRTGSGKSTLVDIMLGLLTPREGAITVDGQNIFDQLPLWWNMVGFVPQSIYLSDETIQANVAFGIPRDTIDEAKIWECLRLAQLSEMVDNLPNGINTMVGERGVRLSGGERQRIGLARALYFDPDILIIDEGTSALDNRTESDLMASLGRLRNDHTIILVAHRLSTVEDCDQIHVFEHGHLVASGRYHELMETSPAFRYLANVGESTDGDDAQS